ncbi:helix-turn-helix domain-containing protein [Castellaniella sp. S9]|uniref:helix-turn-helix domain-containing protein n=1 Tax=Castellaniella sp. S9 TaxID=2993652 RepID=UPI0022B44D0E|nr:helix-turn-helix domain-containing protein [Castellaniella sp. S9]
MNQVPEFDMRMRESAPEDAPLGIGEALRRMREARGFTLQEVSARIKYSAVQLGYLEAHEWARLPGGVPLRGLVRNYARFLDADVEAMLRLLDDEVGPTRPSPTVASLGASQTLRAADMAPKGEPAHRTWSWLLLILVLLCVAGLYAINRGWVPDEWLIFDWLKALKP